MKYPAGSLSQAVGGTERMIHSPDGTALYTLSIGEGSRTVVLAHGYGIDLNEWNMMIPKLVARGSRVITFDQRGHGKSGIGRLGIGSDAMAADYKAIFEEYDLRGATLVGHSMGGFLTMKTLLTYPELMQSRIKDCVLMATFAGDINRNNFQNRLQLPLIKSGILIKLLGIATVGKAFGKSLLGDDPDDEVIRVFVELFKAQNHKALVPILEAFANENYYDQVHKITIPCTVLIGEKDPTTPPFHSNDLARLIPNARKVVIPKKGHGINWEAPDSVVEAILTVS